MSSRSVKVTDQAKIYKKSSTSSLSPSISGSYREKVSQEPADYAPETTKLAFFYAIEASTPRLEHGASQQDVENESGSAGPSRVPPSERSAGDDDLRVESSSIEFRMITCIHASLIGEGSPAFSLLAFQFFLLYASS